MGPHGVLTKIEGWSNSHLDFEHVKKAKVTPTKPIPFNIIGSKYFIHKLTRVLQKARTF
jgi:hypothetical protein